MAISTVNRNITRAISDKQLGVQEAQQVVSQKDAWLSGPESVGTRVDQKEFDAIKGLYQKVQNGEVEAGAEAKQVLRDFLAQGPESRGMHALKGGSIGKSIGAVLAVSGAFSGATAGVTALGVSATTVGGAATAGVLIPAIASGAAVGFGMGYAVGVVQGFLDD
jgi:hypothetical protein